MSWRIQGGQASTERTLQRMTWPRQGLATVFAFFHIHGDRIRTVADLFLSFKEQLKATYLSAEEDWNGLDEYLVDSAATPFVAS